MTAPAPSAVIAGRYVLERPLARGGMGAVWVARHRDLDTQVAIKFMTDAFVSSEDARARFEREAKAAAKLDTKHVVHVHDYGVDDGTPYIVMELLKGEDLAARLAREHRLALEAASVLLAQIAKGRAPIRPLPPRCSRPPSSSTRPRWPRRIPRRRLSPW